MEEIQAAVEIVKIPLQVGTQTVEVAARVMESSIQTMMTLAKFVLQLKKQLEKEQLYGETDLKELVTETQGDLQVYQFPEESLASVKEVFDKLAIRYAAAEDLNAKDGMSELFFPTNNLERVMLAVQKLESQGVHSQIVSKEDYINNADEEHQKEMQEAVDTLAAGIQPEAIKQDAAAMKQRLVYDDLIRDKNKQLFTVNKGLVVDETDQTYVTRIPNTEQFVHFPKNMCVIQDEGNTLCFFEDKNATANILSRNGEIINTLPITELYRMHYDSSWKQGRIKSKGLDSVGEKKL